MSKIKTKTITISMPARLPGPIQVGDWVRLRLPEEEAESTRCGNINKPMLYKLLSGPVKIARIDGEADFRDEHGDFCGAGFVVRCEPNTRPGETPALSKPSPAEVEAAFETLRRASL
jgi:hypothetical protein